MSKFVRAGQRSNDQFRPLRVTYDVFKYASASTLFEMGNTKVLTSGNTSARSTSLFAW